MNVNNHAKLKTKMIAELLRLENMSENPFSLGFRMEDAKKAISLIENFAFSLFETAYKKDPNGKYLYAALMKCPECDAETELIKEYEKSCDLMPGIYNFDCIVRTRRCERCEYVFETYEATPKWISDRISTVSNEKVSDYKAEIREHIKSKEDFEALVELIKEEDNDEEESNDE